MMRVVSPQVGRLKSVLARVLGVAVVWGAAALVGHVVKPPLVAARAKWKLRAARVQGFGLHVGVGSFGG